MRSSITIYGNIYDNGCTDSGCRLLQWQWLQVIKVIVSEGYYSGSDCRVWQWLWTMQWDELQVVDYESTYDSMIYDDSGSSLKMIWNRGPQGSWRVPPQRLDRQSGWDLE